MTRSIEQLEQQLADIQSELVKMKEKQKEAPVATPWALAEPEDECYYFSGTLYGDVAYQFARFKDDINAFAKEEVAQGFANAFRVMILLRQCEGAGQSSSIGERWTVEADGGVDDFNMKEFFTLCPPFPSEELAQAAADKVGIENIKAAYKFLATGE